MNILALADVYSAQVFGGGTRFFLEAAAALARRGHAVDALLPCPDDDDILRLRFPELTYHYYPLELKSGFQVPGMIWRSRRAYSALRRAKSYDIVQVNQPMTAMGPILGTGQGDTPVVYNFQSPWAVEYRFKMSGRRDVFWLLRRHIERAVLHRCRAAVCLSAFMRGALTAEHPDFAQKPVAIVGGGVDVERFTPAVGQRAARADAGFPPDRPVLFTVRGLKPRTGVDALIEAMPAVSRRHPGVLLVVGGEGPLRPQLQAQAEALGLAGRHVRFDGFIGENLLPVYYQAADLFVLPTAALEGFGLVTVESLACGTPVAATPVGATPEILSPLDPALLAGGVTPEAISETVSFWLDNRDRLESLRARCRPYVLDHFTWAHVAENIEKFYIEILKK